MKFAVASLLSLAALVVAQDFSNLPNCAKSCVNDAYANSGCGLSIECFCTKQSVISGVGCCISTVCDVADQQAVLSFATSICAIATVTTATCAGSATNTAVTTTATASSTTTAASGGSTSTAASGTTSASSTTNASGNAAPKATAGALGLVMVGLLAMA